MSVNLNERIWVEKYRPKQIKDCIFPEAIKKTLENFVISGHCPNLMFSSPNGGSGKCLDPFEEIDIIFSDKFYKGKEITVTLEHLFSYFEMDEVPYNELKEFDKEEVFVKTPENVWVPIEGLIKKQDKKIKLHFNDDLNPFICGRKHIVSSSKGLVFAEEAEDVYNVLLGDFSKIVYKEEIPFGDVYDISIESPHLYVTPNGFVHHNTTCIKALCNQLDFEYLFINSSEQRSIEVLRQDVTSFVTTLSLEGRSKAVIFDECDAMLMPTQTALRGFIEQYSKITFFFSCNYIEKMMPQLLSRCSVIDFTWPKEDYKDLKTKFFHRVKDILKNENIEFKKEVVVELINRYFPDFRRIINELQKYSISGKIDEGLLTYSKELDFKDILFFMKEKRFNSIVEWVEKNSDMNFEMFYKNFYKELKSVVQPECLPAIILALAQYEFRHPSMMDKSINLLACLTEILSEVRFK